MKKSLARRTRRAHTGSARTRSASACGRRYRSCASSVSPVSTACTRCGSPTLLLLLLLLLLLSLVLLLLLLRVSLVPPPDA